MLVHILSSSLLILAVAALRSLMRGRASCRTIYALWLAVLLKLLIPTALYTIELPETTAIDYTSAVAKSDSAALSETEDAESGTSAAGFDAARIIRTVWFAGTVITALGFTGCSALIRVRFGKNRKFLHRIGPVRIYESRTVQSACVVGLFCVYLPAGQRSRNALRHEFIHIRRGDTIIVPIKALVCSIYWFNPFVWLAALLSSRDAELACDEAVTAHFSDSERIEYARELVEAASEKSSPVNAFTGRNLKERIIMITGKNKPSAAASVTAAVLVIAIALLSFIGCSERTDSFDGISEAQVMSEMKLQADKTAESRLAQYEAMLKEQTAQLEQYKAMLKEQTAELEQYKAMLKKQAAELAQYKAALTNKDQ